MTVSVQIAAVGLYFGTRPKSQPGKTGVAASKFRDALTVKVDTKASIREVIKATQDLINDGNGGDCISFDVLTTGATHSEGSICTITVSYRGTGQYNGTYSITDSSAYRQNIDGNLNPKFVWQTYLFDKDFTQKNTDGTKTIFQVKDRPGFADGDLIVFRCLVIAKSPIEYVVPPTLPNNALTS